MSGLRDRLMNRIRHEYTGFRQEYNAAATIPQATPTVYAAAAPQATSAPLVNAVYYPNWRIYRDQSPSTLNLDHITHILYAFAWVKADGTIYSSDEEADTQTEIHDVKGALADLKRVKAQRPHIKTLLSVGGGGEGSKNFPTAVKQAHSINRMTATAKHFLDTYHFDGIDIDWEHPETTDQGHQYIHLLSALRATLPRPRYLITSALPAGEWALQHINLHQASQHLDYINLMTYDFAGPWTKHCGNQAQLFSPTSPHDNAASISCDSSVSYVIKQGVHPSKILLGVPAYGRSFIGAKKPGDSYHGCAGEDGTYEYRDLPRPGAKVVFDEKLGATYCVGGDAGFVSYDDQRCVRAKAAFVKQRGLAGLFYWTGTGDTNDERSLVTTGAQALRR